VWSVAEPAPPTVVVLGSVHTDLVATAVRLPSRGETMPGRTFATHPGGKGGNQAAQAALMGVRSRLLGRVGNDPFGERLRAALATKGVDTSLLGTDPDEPTGASAVLAETGGDYASIIVPGASLRLTPALVEEARPAIADADVLLCQLEVSLEAVHAAIAIAHQAGTRVILNASPAPDHAALPAAFWGLIDLLIVNAGEAVALAAPSLPDAAALLDRDPLALAAALRDRLGVGGAVVTLGAAGAAAADAAATLRQAAVPAALVTVVDTIGAGDAFAGALTAELARGERLVDALSVAAAAGALAVARAGAYDALPSEEAVRRLAAAAREWTALNQTSFA
jgi:ribokinase